MFLKRSSGSYLFYILQLALLNARFLLMPLLYYFLYVIIMLINVFTSTAGQIPTHIYDKHHAINIIY